MYDEIEWMEPLGDGSRGGIRCIAKVNEVVDYMMNEYQHNHKNHPNYPYKSQIEALQDFMTIHWASYVK